MAYKLIASGVILKRFLNVEKSEPRESQKQNSYWKVCATHSTRTKSRMLLKGAWTLRAIVLTLHVYCLVLGFKHYSPLYTLFKKKKTGTKQRSRAQYPRKNKFDFPG